ncbi:MAG: hypothetical protein HC772_18195 [Leptolyngbyaceae cyanobacterium CRU_2_3]|nr:hypothetical protein [Leptolyngbyaceae cyanobacterium CRU_2_3]
MSDLESDSPIFKFLLLGGLFLVMLALLVDGRRPGSWNSWLSNSLASTPASSETCQGEVHQEVVLSREKLAAFLTVSEREPKVRVQDILQQPYCQLPTLEVRANVVAERAVYPLAFDPHTWLIVLYEGEEYAGYQFRFQQGEGKT